MSPDLIGLVIFFFCVFLFIWDKLPMATTAILGCTLMVLFGVCSFKDAFSSFASSTVILTIGVMVIGQAIAETGVASAIGAWIVRLCKNSERRLIFGTYIIAAMMSAFLTNSAVLAIFLPIIVALSSSNRSIHCKNLIMPIAIACVLGGASTLVGSTQQMTAQGLLEENGLQMFKTFSFSPLGSVILLFGLIYCLTIGYSAGNRIWGTRVDADEEILTVRAYTAKDIKPVSKFKVISISAIFLGTVILYIWEPIPLAITSTAAALLCIITGCITQKRAIATINWNIVGRLAGCLGIAKALEVSGGTALIAKIFSSIIGSNLSPFIIFAIMVLLTMVMSEFISNSTAILITLPILISIAPTLGLNVYPFAFGMTIASGIALSNPLASSTLGMSMSAGYRFNDYFKHSIFLDIFNYILIILFVPLFFSLTV